MYKIVTRKEKKSCIMFSAKWHPQQKVKKASSFLPFLFYQLIQTTSYKIVKIKIVTQKVSREQKKTVFFSK